MGIESGGEASQTSADPALIEGGETDEKTANIGASQRESMKTHRFYASIRSRTLGLA
jgi:hypothetical protein